MHTRQTLTTFFGFAGSRLPHAGAWPRNAIQGASHMSKQGPRTEWRTSTLFPVLTFLAATVIFLAVTLSPVEIGFAALYVAVVMLSATFLNQQGLVVAGASSRLVTLLYFYIFCLRFCSILPLIPWPVHPLPYIPAAFVCVSHP